SPRPAALTSAFCRKAGEKCQFQYSSTPVPPSTTTDRTTTSHHAARFFIPPGLAPGHFVPVLNLTLGARFRPALAPGDLGPRDPITWRRMNPRLPSDHQEAGAMHPTNITSPSQAPRPKLR